MPGDPEYPAARSPSITDDPSLEECMPVLRKIANRSGQAGTYFCGTGYGMVGEGDSALIAVSSFHDDIVVEGVARALREKGAKVDIIKYDHGTDRERTPVDEVQAAISGLEHVGIDEGDLRIGVFESKYAEYLGLFGPAKEMAVNENYDLLIQSVAGPMRPAKLHYEGDPVYFERIPWQTTQSLLGNATTYPRELYTAINERTYDKIWNEANKGAEVHVTDPEGTDLRYTLLPEYIDAVGTRETPKDNAEYLKGHISFHPLGTPTAAANMNGVLAGTTAHYNSPFPHIEFHVEDGVVTHIDGGGEYGDAVRKLHAETEDVQYPEFDDPGMLWPFEFVVGTQPKAARPPVEKFLNHSGPGTLAERLRSGIIHVGIGTSPTGDNKTWAQENDQPYGHVHVHLLFPTVEIHRTDGEVVKIIENGRLTTLDDPEIRELASQYGSPEELLTEDWVPHIPGISADGEFEQYASDPIGYLMEISR